MKLHVFWIKSIPVICTNVKADVKYFVFSCKSVKGGREQGRLTVQVIHLLQCLSSFSGGEQRMQVHAVVNIATFGSCSC